MRGQCVELGTTDEGPVCGLTDEGPVCGLKYEGTVFEVRNNRLGGQCVELQD